MFRVWSRFAYVSIYKAVEVLFILRRHEQFGGKDLSVNISYLSALQVSRRVGGIVKTDCNASGNKKWALRNS